MNVFPRLLAQGAGIARAMGIRRPVPKALWVTFKTGGACLLLYSTRSTRVTTPSARERTKPGLRG